MYGNVAVEQSSPTMPAWAKRLLLVGGALAILFLALQLLPAAHANPCGPYLPSPPDCYTLSDGSTAAAQNRYRWIDDTDVSPHTHPDYVWTDISGGTPLSIVRTSYGNPPANPAFCHPFGFNFNYYGNVYNCAWINANGYIVLDNTATATLPSDAAPGGNCNVGSPSPPTCAIPDPPGGKLPSATITVPRAMVAGYWVKDLEPGVCGNPPSGNAGLFAQNVAGRFIIEWNGVLEHAGDTPNVNCPTPPPGVPPTCTMPPHAGCFWVTFEIEIVKAPTLALTDTIEVMLNNVQTPDEKPTGAGAIKNYASLGINDPSMVQISGTAQAGSTTTTLVDASKNFIALGVPSGGTATLTFLSGAATAAPGPAYSVSSVTATTITFNPAATGAPNAPDGYKITWSPGLHGLNYRDGAECYPATPNDPDSNCFSSRAIRYYPNHLPDGTPPAPPVTTINEDPGTPASVTLAPLDYDGDDIFCSVTSVPSAFVGTLSPGVGPALPNPACTRTFMPGTDYCTTFGLGSAVPIPMTITDNVGPAPTSLAATGKIDVTCINDAPTISPTPSTSTPGGPAGFLTTFAAFATGVAPGPNTAADEVTQAMDFPMQAPFPPVGAFTSGPTLTRSGGPTSGSTAKLSFVGHVIGSYSNICFKAHDNGGTLLGGIDTSVDKLCFTINVLAPTGAGGGGDCGPLSANFLVSGAPLESGEPISFSDLSTPTSDVQAWSWDFGDGFTDQAPSTTHTYPAPGDYLVRLIVQNAGGCAAFRDQVISIAAPGTFSGNGDNGQGASDPSGSQDGPVVDAGEDAIVREGAQVVLAANARGAPLDSLLYTWRQASGPTITLVNANTRQPSFVAPLLINRTAPIQMLFAVRGSDGHATSVEDFVRVTVVGKDTHAPVADAGHDVTVFKGEALTLDASGSADPDHDAITYAWTRIGGAAIPGLPATGAAVALTAPTDDGAAYIDVKLTVTDATGLVGADTMRIWLQSQATLDSGFQSDPQKDGTVVFTAIGQADQYVWDFGDNTGTESTTQPVIKHKYGAPGTYDVSLRLGSDATPMTRSVTPSVPQSAATVEEGPSGSAIMVGVMLAIVGALVVAGVVSWTLRGRGK